MFIGDFSRFSLWFCDIGRIEELKGYGVFFDGVVVVFVR